MSYIYIYFLFVYPSIILQVCQIGAEFIISSIKNIEIIMFLGSKVRPVCRANNLTANCESIVYTMWDP
jgi:hypothetical protein